MHALDSLPNGPLLSPSSPAAALELLGAGGLEVDQRVGDHWVGDHWVGDHWVGDHWVVARLVQTVQAGLQEVATAHHAVL